jgi:hypothetical protein
VNLLGGNVDTINKYLETLSDASKEVGLKLSIEKTKHMLLSCHQNAGQNHDIKIANRSSEMWQFSYFGAAVTNQNLIQEDIKRRLNLSNTCYHSIQKLLSSCLFKNIKSRKYKL